MPREARCIGSESRPQGGELSAVNAMKKHWRRFWASEDGPTTTEYAVLLALIAAAVIGAMGLFGVRMEAIYTVLDSTLQVF